MFCIDRNNIFAYKYMGLKYFLDIANKYVENIIISKCFSECL